jgi:hypothetical protein
MPVEEISLPLELRMPRQLQIGQPHPLAVAVHDDAVVDPEVVRRMEALAAEL